MVVDFLHRILDRILGLRSIKVEWLATQSCKHCGEHLSGYSLELADIEWRKIKKLELEWELEYAYPRGLVRHVEAVCEHCGGWHKIKEGVSGRDYGYELRRTPKVKVWDT